MPSARAKRRPRLCCLAVAVAASLGCSFPTLAADSILVEESAPQTEAYVINLESSTLPLKPSDRPALAGVKGRTLYVVALEIRGVIWYRLRMGFFGSKKEAEATLAKYEDDFPDAWVALVDGNEIRSAGKGTTVPPALRVPTPTGEGEVADLMRRGNDAMLVGDFSRAVRLYTQVLASPANPYTQDAQELLGVALERNGQLAHARTEYEKYLRLYPKGEGAERVRQRFLGLLTAREATPKPLRSAQKKGADAGWTGFGSFAQYFRWDQVTSAGTTTDQSALLSDLDYSLRHRGSEYDVRARFSGQYEHELATDGIDEGRVSTLYVEALGTGDNFSGSVGRQSRSDSGLLGRFDGAIVSKPLTPKTRLNVSAGLPVEAGAADRINSHKHFAGLSLDVGNVAGLVDTNAFFIQQDVDGLVDRQAVGGEVRYAKEGFNVFALVDYDVSYSTVNTALALAGWAKQDGTTLNLIVDYRMTPVLTTSNALMSQPFGTISDMLDAMDEEEIRKLAEDRTAISRSATISASYPLSEKYLLMGDITASSLSGTPASGGIPETPDTGTETFYSLQLIGNGLLKKGDTTLFGTRYSDMKTADTLSLSLNHRRPVSERLYLNPKLRFDFTQDNDNGDETSIAAGFRVTQQYRKDLYFEGEIAGEWSDRQVEMGDGNTDIYFAYFGLRWDF